MKIIIFISVLFIQLFAYSEWVPLFKEPAPQSEPTGVLDSTLKFKILEKQERFILKNPAEETSHSGIRYPRECTLIEQNGTKGWTIDGIHFDGTFVKAKFNLNKSMLYSIIPSVLLIIAFTTLVVFIVRKKGIKSVQQFIANNKNLALLSGLLFSIKLFLISAILFFAGKYSILSEGDGYFDTGKALFSAFDFSKLNYTIGNSIISGIFGVILKKENFDAIVFPLSYFHVIFTGTVVAICIFILINIFLKSRLMALIGTSAYIIYPFVVQISQSGKALVTDYLGIPLAEQYSFQLYYFSELTGYAAENDFINLLGILLLILLTFKFFPFDKEAWKEKERWAKLLAVGVFLGLLCTVRISDIFMAPLIIYIIIKNLIPLEKSNLKENILYCFLFIAGALLGFAPQLVANYLQADSVFTFPCINPELPSHDIAMIFQNLSMLLNGISILFSVAAGGFMLLKKEQRLFFALYIIPLVLYYGISAHTAGDPIKFLFPVYPALFILITLFMSKKLFAFAAFILTVGIFKQSTAGIDFFIIAVLLIGASIALFKYREKISFVQRHKENIKAFTVVLAVETVIIASKLVL